MTTYSVTITYGERYNVSGFTSEAEAQAFIQTYKHNQARLERDFMELPYFATCQSLDIVGNLAEITANNPDTPS